MFEGADKPLPVIEDFSVNPNSSHVVELERMADEAGVPKGNTLPPLHQSDNHCTWEDDLKANDKNKGG